MRRLAVIDRKVTDIHLRSPVIPEGLRVLLSADAWYDGRDFTATSDQTWINRLRRSATPASLGPTTGVDVEDPVISLSGDYLTFDGANDYVTQPVTDMPTATKDVGAFTVFQLSRTPANGAVTKGLWSCGNGNFEGFNMYESGGSVLTVSARDSGAGAVNRTVGTSGGDNVLRGKAMIVDNGTIRGFVSNGAGTSTWSATSSITALADINNAVGVGPRMMTAAASGVGAARSGDLYVHAQWSRPLTRAELEAVTVYTITGGYS